MQSINHLDVPKSSVGVIWITGYSASGKTAVARKLEFRLRSDGLRTVYLDGDDLRAIFGHQWGYAREERIELARVYFRLCSHLAAQGMTVIISAVAMYDEVRNWLKTNVPNAIEVFLDVPEAERYRRDAQTKKIYKKGQDQTQLYDYPKSPDLVIANYGQTDSSQAADIIRSYFYTNQDSLPISDHGRQHHWEQYYLNVSAPQEPSPFAKAVALQVPAGCRLLEVGCGNGRDAVFFARMGFAVTALDTCQNAIAAIKRNYSGLPLSLYAGELADYAQQEAGRFSIIYSRFVLHAMTLAEENRFFQHAVELLEHQGNLFLECRSINDQLAREGEVISPTERLCGHYRRFIVIDELLARLQAVGFVIQDAIEAQGLARLGDQDPVVIRVTARFG